MNKDEHKEHIITSCEKAVVNTSETNGSPLVQRKHIDISVPQKTVKEQRRQEKEHRRLEKERQRGIRAQRKAERTGQPVRRVGTFTMGIFLILGGIFVLWWLFFPTVDIGFVAYFAPVLLIMLGCEVLYQYFFHQGERLKYDFASSMICLFLFGGCILLGFVPLGYRYYGPERYITETRLESDIYQAYYEVLKDSSTISSLEVNVNLAEIAFDPEMSYLALSPADSIHMEIGLRDVFDDKVAFAAACKNIVRELNPLDIPYSRIRFSSEANGGRYSLYLSRDKFIQNVTNQELGERVVVHQEQG